MENQVLEESTLNNPKQIVKTTRTTNSIATTVKLAGLLDGSLAGRKRSASDVGELDVLCNELDNIGQQHLEAETNLKEIISDAIKFGIKRTIKELHEAGSASFRIKLLKKQISKNSSSIKKKRNTLVDMQREYKEIEAQLAATKQSRNIPGPRGNAD